MKTSILRTLLISSMLLMFSGAAMAQYAWIDEKGVKQFSDQPPPPNTPKNKILKFAGKMFDADQPDQNSDGAAPAVKAPPSVAEQELAYKKRQQAAALQSKKDDDAAKQAATKADNCARLRQYKQGLDSGMRITPADASGNRAFMSDDQRAQEQASTNQQLSECN